MSRAGIVFQNGWHRVPLVEVCDIIQGQSPPGETYNSYGDGLPFFQGKAEFGDYYPTPIKWCTQPKKIAEPGDVLISIRAPVGPTNLCPLKSCIGRGLAALRPKNGVPSKYLLYAVRASVEELISKATGSTFEAVSGKDLRAHEISLASEEQRSQIVAEIEKQFTRLEVGVAGLRRVQANLKRYRAAVLKAACEGKLVPTEAELARQEGRTYETGAQLLDRILTERRKKWNGKGKYKEPNACSDDKVRRLPEGWYYAKLDALLPPQRVGMKTGPFGTLLKKADQQVHGIPVLGIENIESMKFVRGSKIHITREKWSGLVSYGVDPGDILISRSGTVGEVCIVPAGLGDAIISTNLLRVSLQRYGMLPMFFCFLFNGSPFVLGQVQDLCKGSTRDFLNQHILNSVVFPLPPFVEQQRIVAEVERRLSVVEELEAVVNSNIQRAIRLRQSILKSAFDGSL